MPHISVSMAVAERRVEAQRRRRKKELVELPLYHYTFHIDTLFRWLEHFGLIEPNLVEVNFTVSAGEKGFVDLWLPWGKACVERYFEVYFPYIRGIKYGWMVDRTDIYTVPMHYFVPNSGSVEHNIFGRYWVKWWFLRFHYEAYENGTITIRAWARLIDHENAVKLLEISEKLYRRFKFKVVIPETARRPTTPPYITYSEVVKQCPICGAKLIKKNGYVIRVGQWGKNYSDHDCPVFK